MSQAVYDEVDAKYRKLLDFFNEHQIEPDLTTIAAIALMLVQMAKIQGLPLLHVVGAVDRAWHMIQGKLMQEVVKDGN